MSIGVHCEDLTIIIIDDEAEHRHLVRHAVEDHCDPSRSFQIVEYEEPDVALANLPPQGDVVLLIDYNLGGASGLDWIQDFSRTASGPVIIITSAGDEQIAATAFRMGATDYLDKDDIIQDPMGLWKSINRAMRRFKLERTNRELSKSLKLANAELTAKNERLAMLTQNAQQFVEDVAHEFRTPLTVIGEFASIMSDGIGGEITAKQCSYLNFISEATSDLANLIDDFLDSGKLRTGMLRVSRESHKPDDIIHGAWRMIESRASSKNVHVELELQPGLPNVYADAEKASRALLNLATNAIKFTNPDGQIHIRAIGCGEVVRFEVEDTGPGLSPEEIDGLFKRFRQCNGSQHITEKGFGLGLSIVRDLVSINLGVVEIWSTLGEGSVFAFTVPVDEPDCIIGAFMRKVEERAEDAPVVALCAHTDSHLCGSTSLSEYLASICYGDDLVLQLPERDSVVLLGQTPNHKQWVRRLQDAHESRCVDSGETPVKPLGIDVIGMWHTDEDASGICRAVTRAPAGGEYESLGIDR